MPIGPSCGVCARGRFTNQYEVACSTIEILGADLLAVEASQGMHWRWPRNNCRQSRGWRRRRVHDLQASKKTSTPFMISVFASAKGVWGGDLRRSVGAGLATGAPKIGGQGAFQDISSRTFRAEDDLPNHGSGMTVTEGTSF